MHARTCMQHVRCASIVYFTRSHGLILNCSSPVHRILIMNIRIDDFWIADYRGYYTVKSVVKLNDRLAAIQFVDISSFQIPTSYSY